MPDWTNHSDAQSYSDVKPPHGPSLQERSASMTVQLDTGMAMTLGCIRPARAPADDLDVD